MAKNRFAGRVTLNSATGSAGVFTVNMTFADLEGVFSGTSCLVGDSVFFDTGASETGTITRFDLTAISSKTASTVVGTLTYNAGDANPGGAPDLSFNVSERGFITRRSTARGVAALPDGSVQGLPSKLATHVRNEDFFARLDAAGGAVDPAVLASKLDVLRDWNAATNTPTITAGTAITDRTWFRVTVAGARNVTGALVSFSVDDLIVWNATTSTWVHVPSTSFQSPQLYNWFRGGISGKKMAWVGDSTTFVIFNTPQLQTYLNTRHVNNAGSALFGITNAWFGSNGNTLLNHLAGTPAGFGIDDVIAAAPNVIVFCYGINDCRLQASAPTLGDLIARITTAVNKYREKLPNADILLRMPNSFLTTDVGAQGFVVPNSWAQGATDLLRNAYRALENRWPNVRLLDTQKSIFPEASLATHVNMGDQIHPSVTGGYTGIIDAVAAELGVIQTYHKGLADDARAGGYIDEFVRYANATLDSKEYELITTGTYSSQGSGFIDFAGEIKYIGHFLSGDVVNMAGQFAFALPSSFSQILSGSIIRLSGLGAGVPTYAQTGGIVSVYRRKFAGIALAKNYLPDSDVYPFQVRVSAGSGAGANFIRLVPLQGRPASDVFNVTAEDTLIHPTLGPVSLSTGSFSRFSNSGIQINRSATDFTMPAGTYDVFVVGPTRNLDQTQAIFSAIGALTPGTARCGIVRGGVYKNFVASLGTNGTTTTTIELRDSGVLLATITFLANNGTPTIAYVSTSQFSMLSGSTLSAVITAAGASAADLVITIGG